MFKWYLNILIVLFECLLSKVHWRYDERFLCNGSAVLLQWLCSGPAQINCIANNTMFFKEHKIKLFLYLFVSNYEISTTCCLST